jgi:hypothetical protein
MDLFVPVRPITIPLTVLILSRFSFFLNRLVLVDTKNNDAFRYHRSRLSDTGVPNYSAAFDSGQVARAPQDPSVNMRAQRSA